MVARGARERAGRASRSPTTASASSAPTLPHIFEPFYTSDDAQGSGLGLAIARELAERMDGQLAVDSVPGAHHLHAGAAGMRQRSAVLAGARPRCCGRLLAAGGDDNGADR